MKIVLLGHGHCATGFLSSLKMIAGEQEHIEAIDFSDSMTPQELDEKLELAIKNEDEVFILCDLLGGTPFKLAVAYALRSSTQKIEVVSGMNLSMLLEVSLGANALSSDTVAKVVSSAKNGIVTSTDLFESSDETEQANGEGI